MSVPSFPNTAFNYFIYNQSSFVYMVQFRYTYIVAGGWGDIDKVAFIDEST